MEILVAANSAANTQRGAKTRCEGLERALPGKLKARAREKVLVTSGLNLSFRNYGGGVVREERRREETTQGRRGRS